MPEKMGYSKDNKDTKIGPMNGPLTPTPDVGHGVKNRGKYSANQIPDRVKQVGSGGKSKNPF